MIKEISMFPSGCKSHRCIVGFQCTCFHLPQDRYDIKHHKMFSSIQTYATYYLRIALWCNKTDENLRYFQSFKKIIEKNLFKTKTENVIQRKYILFRKKEQQVKLVCTKYPQYDASQLGWGLTLMAESAVSTASCL